jgi:SAM-dependent methyltransferase
MQTLPNPFEEYPDRFDDWFEKNRAVYESELLAVRTASPEVGLGLEIGVGTGRFAEPLGVKIGIDPALNALKMAQSRGIVVVRAVGEQIPFKAETFDWVLLVTTICSLDDPEKALKECHRVLRKNGVLVIAMIDRESELGRQYEKRKQASTFYRFARFRSTKEVEKILEYSNFEIEKYYQTLTSANSPGKRVEMPKQGFGQGSFVVVRARKR